MDPTPRPKEPTALASMSGGEAPKKGETSSGAQDAAENLRLRGNDAFSTGDWRRACELYVDALKHGNPASKESAKIHSNLAATFCKLNDYELAADAAERATAVDPGWPKGWWRRGVVSELQKEFLAAICHYNTACDLENTNRVFRKALQRCADRSGYELGGRDKEGNIIISKKKSTELLGCRTPDLKRANSFPGAVVWRRIRRGGVDVDWTGQAHAWTQEQMGKPPNSEQWIGQGLITWHKGMTNSLASLVFQWQHVNPECRDAVASVQHLQMQLADAHQLEAAYRHVLGGVPMQNNSMDLLSGFIHLGGDHILFENGSDIGDNIFVQVPPCLSFMTHHQMHALQMEVCTEALHAARNFGKPVRVSSGVKSAIHNNFRSGNMEPPTDDFESGSPQEVVEYCVELLGSGKTWNEGVRRLVSLNYRGTILFGICARLVGHLAESYKCFKWAREFIEFAEQQWHVRKSGAYEEKGSVFRISLQVNVMAAELGSHSILRGGSLNLTGGSYPIDEELVLAKKVIDAANSVDGFDPNTLEGISMIVAFKRKPIASVHGKIAATLMELSGKLSPEDFSALLCHVGLLKASDKRNKYAIIAEHYRTAAEAELPDADDAAILWWGFAANMVRALGGYTMGDLRAAITEAENASRLRDVEIFGPDRHLGGSYEMQARLVADHYANEDDSFIIPELKFTPRMNGVSGLEIDGDILCHNFSEYITRERAAHQESNKSANKMLDVSDIEERHGAARDDGIPSLKVLCVRSLHEQECEYARGQSDPSLIVLKALQSGAVN